MFLVYSYKEYTVYLNLNKRTIFSCIGDNLGFAPFNDYCLHPPS